jgi:D-alanyl-D-alanine carboxypeptidase (penicillin-binding protein 5/6)
MTINNRIIAPLSKGQPLGSVQVQLGDAVIAGQDLVALQGVNEGSIWRRIVDEALLYFE